MKLLYNPHTLTCTITVPDMLPSAGIQKIIGLARGLSFHRVPYKPYWHISNSIVLGCNRDSETSPVRLFMYAYVDGKLIDPKTCVLGLFDVGVKLKCLLGITNDYWITIENKAYIDLKLKEMPKTLPIGFLLNNYAEIDNTNKQTPFHCLVEDLRVNGRVIKI